MPPEFSSLTFGTLFGLADTYGQWPDPRNEKNNYKRAKSMRQRYATLVDFFSSLGFEAKTRILRVRHQEAKLAEAAAIANDDREQRCKKFSGEEKYNQIWSVVWRVFGWIWSGWPRKRRSSHLADAALDVWPLRFYAFINGLGRDWARPLLILFIVSLVYMIGYSLCMNLTAWAPSFVSLAPNEVLGFWQCLEVAGQLVLKGTFVFAPGQSLAKDGFFLSFAVTLHKITSSTLFVASALAIRARVRI